MYQYDNEQAVIDGALNIATQRLHGLREADHTTSSEAIKAWLRVRFAGVVDHEEFVVVYLTGMGGILGTETIGIGTSKSVPGDVQRIVRRALELQAESVAFAHNHPMRTEAEPSDNDRKAASMLAAALGFFGIDVMGAYVVAGRDVATIDPDLERYRMATAAMLRAKNPAKTLAGLLAKHLGAPLPDKLAAIVAEAEETA